MIESFNYYVDQFTQLHPIVFAIIAGLIGSVLAIPVYNRLSRLRIWRRDYDGVWLTEIFDTGGNVVKRDEMVLQQTGDDLEGLICRIFPEDQAHRRWHFRGHVRGEVMLGMFWATENIVTSYGCWYVTLTQARDYCFEGLYFRSDGSRIIPVRLRLTKQTH